MKVSVLRLGHRFERDKRVSTHLALTARAFGADEILFDERDVRVAESVARIVEGWGGDFCVGFVEGWRRTVTRFDGEVVHLTMYGLSLDEVLPRLKESGKDKLVVVGGRKVPPDMYDLASFNVAVGHQPHSEISALAVFLDRLFEGQDVSKRFDGGKKIIPQERGKKVVDE
ncbi:MAG: tRNA (cytidine(56)-2'-O)-methyltransferase [Candidatus Altiarchaeota archaeon]